MLNPQSDIFNDKIYIQSKIRFFDGHFFKINSIVFHSCISVFKWNYNGASSYPLPVAKQVKLASQAANYAHCSDTFVSASDPADLNGR